MKRKTVGLSSSMERGLKTYTLAASAAGVGALALAQPAEARIIYTKVHHRISTNTYYPIDLNHDGVPEISLLKRYVNATSVSIYERLLAEPLQANHVEGSKAKGIMALKRGARIGPPWSDGFSGFMAYADL